MVPRSQTPPCPSSGSETCSALGALGVVEVGAERPRLSCPQLAGAPESQVRAPLAGRAGSLGSGESGLGWAVPGLGVAADLSALCTLPSKGSSDLPLQNRARSVRWKTGQPRLGQTRWPFLSRGLGASSEGELWSH